jgi:DNA-binding transcriptional LysR family regulator
VAVAEELHFGRAAARLNISQPPLSLAIRQLEEDLGVTLLVRSNKTTALTTAGAAFYGEAVKILTQAEEARHLASRAAHGAVRRLRIGIPRGCLQPCAQSAS